MGYIIINTPLQYIFKNCQINFSVLASLSVRLFLFVVTGMFVLLRKGILRQSVKNIQSIYNVYYTWSSVCKRPNVNQLSRTSNITIS